MAALCVKLRPWLTRTITSHRTTQLNLADLTLTLLSCIFFMALVAFVSYQKTKGKSAPKKVTFWQAGAECSIIAGSCCLRICQQNS